MLAVLKVVMKVGWWVGVRVAETVGAMVWNWVESKVVVSVAWMGQH